MRVLEPPDGQVTQLPADALDLVPDQPGPTHPLVVVHWLDAWYDPDEQKAEDWREEYAIQTVGYLVRDEGHVVSIAQEILPDGEGFRAVTHIPRPMVQRIDRLVPDVPGTAAGATPA
ncbi:MAG: hypothetical protein WD206_08325 [Actinomycetota bacterium]